MGTLAIVGTGFVADYYMRSASVFPHHTFTGAWDLDPDRLASFSAHWNVPAARSFEELLTGPKRPDLLINLTNPRNHFEVSRAALEAGVPVYCEKPLATTLEDAEALADLSARTGVPIASAPCSVLGETAQTLWRAVRRRRVGRPLFVYAELDDGFIPQAPYQKWFSETGKPWPARDEFEVGCTLEHAGYWLTWLMAMFGPVRTVTASSGVAVRDKLGDGTPTAPDWSTAVLCFDEGVVARLTVTIVGKHDHSLRVVCERGTLAVDGAWNNRAPVKVARRAAVRRRLVEGFSRELVPLLVPPWRQRWRKPPVAMNYMLGPDEMLDAMANGRAPRLAGDFALHLTEVTLAMQNAGLETETQRIQSSFDPLEPMAWAKPTRRRQTMEPIKLGVVGTGGMAALMLDAIASEPRLDAVAVASRSKDRADAFAGQHEIERAYGSLDELLASDVDAIYIVNEPARHAEDAIAALRVGKPVLCEKPFALDVASAEAVIAAARETGTLFMEALWTPLLPSYRRALALLEAGEIGEPLHISMEFGYPASAASHPGLFRPTDGGVVFDRLVYPLVLARLVLGEVADMDAVITRREGVDVHASVLLSHANGGTSQLAASLVTLMGNTARIAGTGGTIRLEEPVVGTEKLSIKRMTAPAGAAPSASLSAPPPGAGTKAQVIGRLKRSGLMRRVQRARTAARAETHSYGANQYGPLLAHFCELVANGARESERIPHDLSLDLMRLLARARGEEAARAPSEAGPPLASGNETPGEG